MNNRGQFICVRYLPNAALLLVRKSRLMVTFLLLMLRFPSIGVSYHNNVVIGQPQRWICLWGAIILKIYKITEIVRVI